MDDLEFFKNGLKEEIKTEIIDPALFKINNNMKLQYNNLIEQLNYISINNEDKIKAIYKVINNHNNELYKELNQKLDELIKLYIFNCIFIIESEIQNLYEDINNKINDKINEELKFKNILKRLFRRK